ncbi:leaf rust 10 disease-resistance locus receptor-like protein kinase-like 1.2 [Quercus suber]|uniref:non-specific serine/threonine protein kinase n=1 Tax=Quercus suber TaxID=58331 RepID=A0AAW0KPH5_QUESU
MSQTNLLPTLLSPISPMIILCILFFSLVPKKSLGAVDPYFQACSARKTCGDGQAIRFPFYIQDKQNSSCGYPGFNLSCNNNGHPTIIISNKNYTINEIFYQNETLRVSNSAFSNPNFSCIPSINSISLPGSRFDLAPNQTNIFLFYNCSSSVHESWPSEFYPSCYGESDTVLALSGQDPRLQISNVSMECKSSVVAPVEAYGGGIGESLRNGFVLKWKASNCSICEDSGGNCGFDSTMYHFKCFCPDRPHAWDCTNTTLHEYLPGQINILIFSFLLESVLPSNSTRYEACKPTNCGTDPNISFPFYVFGTETDHCGYPGLGIVCNRGKPVYRTLERQYVIQDIFYENQTFRLVDEEFANNSRFPPPYKFSFELSFLEFTPNDAKLFFFNNCTAPLSVSFERSLIPCSSRATSSSLVALVKKDEHLSESTACRPSAIVPVEVEGGYSNQTIKKCQLHEVVEGWIHIEMERKRIKLC